MKDWQRSSYCEGGHCAEVYFASKGVLLRSSVCGDTVFLKPDEWEAFVAGVKNGEFDLPERA